MKKNIRTSTLLLFVCINIYSQNLVTNPSFEDKTSCPTGGSQIHTTLNWYASRWSPDYFNSCAPTQIGGVSVPSNGYGYQQAATGNAYAGVYTYGSNAGDTVLREYLGAQLSNPLSVGQKYYVSLKINSSGNLNMNCRTNNIGVLFSTISYKNPLDDNFNTSNQAPIRNFAHVYTTTVVSDSLNWVIISGSFIADSVFNYIMIGSFFDNQHTSHIKMDASSSCLAYYFVDDICVSTDSLTCMGITGTGIKEQNTVPVQLKISPNPSKEMFNIELLNQQNFSLLVYDVTGQKVYENKNATGTVKIDCSNLNSGIYFVRAVNQRTVLTGKMIKE